MAASSSMRMRSQRINPTLKGLLPSEAKHYGFDRGLVLMAADARQFVIRGPAHEAVAYTPPPPPAPPEGRLQANGTREIVPTLPFGDVPARQVTLQGKWLGLYSEKEAADAGNDEWGKNLRWPYSVFNEGPLARRGFWRAKIVAAQRFDDRFERLAELTPVASAPTFLNGRFAKDPQTGAARVLDDPAGVLVWHSTRIDDAGRLALTRLDADLKARVEHRASAQRSRYGPPRRELASAGPSRRDGRAALRGGGRDAPRSVPGQHRSEDRSDAGLEADGVGARTMSTPIPLPEPADFLADTAVERVGEGLHRIELSDRWNAAMYPFGSVASVLALRAMQADLGETRAAAANRHQHVRVTGSHRSARDPRRDAASRPAHVAAARERARRRQRRAADSP